MELRKAEMAQIQSEALNAIFADKIKPNPDSIENPFLRKLTSCSAEVVEAIFGEIGAQLKTFSSKASLSHPDIGEISNFSDDTSKALIELLAIAQFVVKDGMTAILPHLQSIPNRLSESVVKVIGEPVSTLKAVRFLQDANDRLNARIKRGIKPVKLDVIKDKGEVFWNQQPNDFNLYVRFNNYKEKEIQKAEAKAFRFKQLRCSGLETEIRKSIELFKNKMEEVYYGFHRLSMSTASVVLAKMHGYRFGFRSVGTNTPVPDIFIEKNVFYAFDVYNPHRPKEAVSYTPRMYPFALVEDLASDDVRTAVKKLDSMPEVNGRPIFDHIIAVVPGINQPNVAKWHIYKRLEFRLPDGSVKQFNGDKAIFESQVGLDAALIKSGHLNPIILGERNGKCYFICFMK